ncbi:hypothetical protein LTS08_004823 [Lithohypha guttulata]|uniref:Uncharacterized protein n=1 Tax=Lithohypha guttulata TaxID=1690604 RepID=A0AAN7T401_9EURO|nr:hypothetical protein LTR05_002335 [Lithohypha guttulata]KAK5101216.1 hypothetical protein LTS08_004823 [Lithohypha guttulata]
MNTICAPSMKQLLGNYDALDNGDLPSSAHFGASCPSSIDETRAPPGGAVLHFFCMTKYDIRGGASKWDDENMVETQVDNFDTVEGTIEFMEMEEFRQNLMGADFYPEEFVQRVRGGEDDKVIKKRPDVGPRARKEDFPPQTYLATC